MKLKCFLCKFEQEMTFDEAINDALKNNGWSIIEGMKKTKSGHKWDNKDICPDCRSVREIIE